MHKITVDAPTGMTVGSGEILGLSKEQFATRSHRVEVLLDEQYKGAFVPVRVLEPLQFKSGEVIYLDRAPKSGAATPAAAKPPAAAKGAKKSELDKARADGHAAGRAEMLAEVVARNEVIEAAEAAGEAVLSAKKALEAETNADKRAPLQKALDEALEAEEAANDKVDDLPELKA